METKIQKKETEIWKKHGSVSFFLIHVSIETKIVDKETP